ncbi:MAG: DUF4386 domain-containing protein [Candidatus Marinimicrobia bacterium]|nr:DUF4386 domain-containing protein [Candidatus Neomarinimicrobiota bacterium]
MNIINKSEGAISLSNAGLITGIGLVLMTVLALVAMPSIQGLSAINIADDLVKEIIKQETGFRINIVLVLVIVLLDVMLAWSMYLLVKPVNENLALLQGWLRMVYAAVFAAALGNLISITDLLHQAGAEVQIASLLDGFMNAWSLGLTIFGLHLVVLGYLIIKSTYIPKVIGYLVVLAGAGYMIDSIGKILFADYVLNVGMFTFFGEVLLGFWLVFKARSLAVDS